MARYCFLCLWQIKEDEPAIANEVVTAHESCAFDYGLDICSNCKKVLPSFKMVGNHICEDCQKKE